MRALLLIALFTLTLTACGNRMQQLETAGTKVKECLNKCALCTPSVSDCKKNKEVSRNEAVTDDKTGGRDRIQSIWNNHLNMW